MPTAETLNARAPRPHTHKAGTEIAEAQCPYCGQPISRKEFKEIQARIEGEERARIAKVEQNLKDRFAREKAQAEATAKAAIEKAQKDAAKTADAKIKAAIANQERVITTRLATLREAAEKKLAEAVAAERTKAYDERMKLDTRLQELQRQLQRKTAGELGDEAEIDLFAVLTREFPGDQIARVPKGRSGADILHDVVHQGVVVGRVIYDSKNHKRWQSRFTAKLRQDMIDHGADHGVLSTFVFPSGVGPQLAIQNGVLIAAPARVVVLAHLLRQQIVQVHALRLSNEGRVGKTAELYQFITSDRCSQLFDQLGSLTANLVDLDARETSSHQTTWNRRAELLRAVQRLNADFTGEVARIVSGSGASP